MNSHLSEPARDYLTGCRSDVVSPLALWECTPEVRGHDNPTPDPETRPEGLGIPSTRVGTPRGVGQGYTVDRKGVTKSQGDDSTSNRHYNPKVSPSHRGFATRSHPSSHLSHL